MKKTTSIVRIILGVMIIVPALNAFLQFMPMPQPSPEMGAFMGALAATSYIFPLIALIEIGAGLMLLANKFTPLALVMLAPVMVNALMAHLFLNDIGGIGAAVLVSAMLAYLIYAYREQYYPLLKTS